jgi:site-specific DNA-methyltransferase (adenine-specific)
MEFLKGDCLELMKTLPDKSIDCFVCDLPYGCLADNRKKQPNIRRADNGKPLNRMNVRITGCGWDIKINLDLFWTEVKRLAKNDHTPVLMFCTTKFGAELIASNPDWFRYDLVWAKSNGVGFLCANKMPLRSHELIYVFSKKGAYYKRIDVEGNFPETVKEGHIRSKPEIIGIYGNDYKDMSKSNKGIRCVKSVIGIANKKAKGNHPTQKPDELYEWLLKRYCPDGGTMLDPTAGSFASCFTAHKLGIKAIGIEMNEEFYNKACLKKNLF